MIKKVIVAPLNWGLGHATRCVPIIHKLIQENYEPVIASDGQALSFLEQEFPSLETIKLPSYHIRYGKHLKMNLLLKIPTILSAVKRERLALEEYLQNNEVIGIISDNRFGCYSKSIPSVYITHQINVFSGIATFFTSKVHQHFIQKFDECWVPDEKESVLSGKLSMSQINKVKFIGVLSRFQLKKVERKHDVLIVLSGPEPNRTYVEEKLLSKFQKTNKKVRLIRGIVENEQKEEIIHNVSVLNYALSNQLEEEILSSDLVICRSGYSSIMDLAVLNTKMILIPTRGQSEQVYLANYLYKKFGIKNCKEDQLDRILEIEAKKLPQKKTDLPENLFRLFQSK